MVAHGNIARSNGSQKGLDRHLIRAGWLVLGATLLGWISGEWTTWIGYATSAVLLGAGYRLAWEHKQVQALRQIMAVQSRISAAEIKENLGLRSAQLSRAIQRLNRESDPSTPMFIVWDHAAGRLENRLADRGKVIRITSCAHCNAQVDHLLHTQLETLPHCEFCGALLGEAEWQQVADTAQPQRAQPVVRNHPKFHFLIFVLLLCVLPIPVALLYAAWTTGLGDQLFEALKQHLRPHRV